MGKSEGNFITLADLEKKGINPLAYRYLVLSAHYRQKLNFSWESLKSAEKSLHKLYAQYLAFKSAKKSTASPDKKYLDKFTDVINTDLNTPKALALLHKLIGDKRVPPGVKIGTLNKMDEVLGLGLNEYKPIKAEIPAKILKLAAKREQFRRNKQFVQADRLREKIERLGYVMSDTPAGPVIRRKS